MDTPSRVKSEPSSSLSGLGLLMLDGDGGLTGSEITQACGVALVTVIFSHA